MTKQNKLLATLWWSRHCAFFNEKFNQWCCCRLLCMIFQLCNVIIFLFFLTFLFVFNKSILILFPQITSNEWFGIICGQCKGKQRLAAEVFVWNCKPWVKFAMRGDRLWGSLRTYPVDEFCNYCCVWGFTLNPTKK